MPHTQYMITLISKNSHYVSSKKPAVTFAAPQKIDFDWNLQAQQGKYWAGHNASLAKQDKMISKLDGKQAQTDRKISSNYEASIFEKGNYEVSPEDKMWAQ